MRKMKQKKIILSAVKKEDCRDLWLWRNHPAVKKYSFNTELVPWEKHKKWFLSKVKDRNTKIYIARLGKDKVGVIRFKMEKDSIVVSVNLNPNFFGKHLGREIIKLGTEKILKEIKTNKPVIAEVKKDNIASQKAFSKAGYKFIKEIKEKLIYKYRG